MASAAPSIHFSLANPVFGGTFGEARLTAVGQEEILCTKESHVAGQWTTELVNGENTGSTGHLASTFTDCHPKEQPTLPCTTFGAATGTIVVASSEFHLVYITSDVATPNTMFAKTVGLLITAPKKEGVSQRFTTFDCTFLIHIKVAGNGILGHVTTPKCGEKSGTTTVDFHSNSKGVQTYKLARTTAPPTA